MKKTLLTILILLILPAAIILPALAAEGDAITMRYDDRLDVGDAAVTVLDNGTPTSFRVGSGIPDGTMDTAVVTYDPASGKLIATGIKTESGVAAYVEPTLVASTEPESAVPSNFNLITFEGENVGRLSFFGQGAGRFPTAYNVVQDCIDVVNGVTAFYSTSMQPVAVDNGSAEHAYYVRYAGSDAWLDEIKDSDWGEGILTKPVSVAQMHQWAAQALNSDPHCFFAGVK